MSYQRLYGGAAAEWLAFPRFLVWRVGLERLARGKDFHATNLLPSPAASVVGDFFRQFPPVGLHLFQERLDCLAVVRISHERFHGDDYLSFRGADYAHLVAELILVRGLAFGDARRVGLVGTVNLVLACAGLFEYADVDRQLFRVFPLRLF